MENSKVDIKLSICIPTYNRAGFLGETLESVISQASDNIEIVVVDGASTDNTADVVRLFSQKFRNIVYYRGEKKMGVDRDMAKSIEIAHGEYCWMLSDDDLLAPGAIKRMLKEIEFGYEIYLCNVTACDLFMRPITDRIFLSENVKDRVFNLQNKNELMEYCNKAKSIGALFSYMSSIVLLREEWNKTGYNYDFDGSAYALASSLLSFIKRRCRLKYIKEPLILWRNDNESFQNAGGLAKRFLLDFDGYLRLADRYLSYDLAVRDSFLKVMTREHPWYTIINATSFIDSSEEWGQFKARLLKFGYNRTIVTVCYMLGRQKKLVSLGVKMKRRIVRSRLLRRFIEPMKVLYR